MSKTVAIALTLIVASMSASRPAAQTFSGEKGLGRWLDAVAQHRPGEADAAGSQAVSWTLNDLERLLPSLLDYLNAARKRETKNQPRVSCRSCQVSIDERDRLLNETESRVGKSELRIIESLPRPDVLNNLILRAVILHSDAVMRFPKDTARRSGGTPSTNVLRAPRTVATTADGQFVGTTAETPHWFMARALLQFVTPEPALNADTRRWYLAASAYMAATSDLAQLTAHLEKMAALYPEDADVAFDLGWQAEVNSMPRVQAHLRALLDVVAQRRKGGGLGMPCQLVVPCDANGIPYGIKNERGSLSDAERQYARAVALDPLLTEAHVRLAHTRTRLGRHAEAEAGLRNLPPSDDPFVIFYAALVHGLTLEGLGRLDDAAAAYQRALVLSPPYAPSVNLALSALEQRRGDATLSVAYARRAVEPQGNDVVVVDPFAFYHLGRGRKVGEAWAAYYAGLARAQ